MNLYVNMKTGLVQPFFPLREYLDSLLLQILHGSVGTAAVYAQNLLKFRPVNQRNVMLTAIQFIPGDQAKRYSHYFVLNSLRTHKNSIVHHTFLCPACQIFQGEISAAVRIVGKAAEEIFVLNYRVK